MIMRRFSSDGDVDRAWKYVLQVKSGNKLRVCRFLKFTCEVFFIKIQQHDRPSSSSSSPVFRVMAWSRPTSWRGTTVKKPSDTPVCSGRPRRETPSSGSLRWCSPETNEPPVPGASLQAATCRKANSPPSPMCLHRGGRRHRDIKRERSNGRPVQIDPCCWFQCQMIMAASSFVSEHLIRIRTALGGV